MITTTVDQARVNTSCKSSTFSPESIVVRYTIGNNGYYRAKRTINVQKERTKQMYLRINRMLQGKKNAL